MGENVPIYINGNLIGETPDGEKVVEVVTQKRRSGELPATVSVTYDKGRNEILINLDAGRVVRPLIIVEKGKPLLTEEHLNKLKSKEINWGDLSKQGVIEWIDAEEENNLFIAAARADVTEKHTHLEVDPIGLIGIAASTIPYINHNLSARNLQAAKQMKQSLGLYASNYNLRMDTLAYLLSYPQGPLVHTKTRDYLKSNRRPDAQNAVIALMPYYGYNTQDAIVINKGSIDRGFARGFYFKTYTAEEKIYSGGQKDNFEVPTEEITGYRGDESYVRLGEDGIVAPETFVKEGEVLVGGTSPPRFLEEISEFGLIEEKRREKSIENALDSEGYADTVVLSESRSGTKTVQIKMRAHLIPELGDKFSSMHYQKGVIGAIVSEEDIPFTRDGIKPDLIINPAAIPSRMIMAQVLEILLGKKCSMQGVIHDGTAFNPVDYSDIKKVLINSGLRPDGKEAMYDGITGEKLEAEIFVGVGYYRRLKHITRSIIQARGRGKVQMLTRQPTEGKARQGGLKLEEMQRDALIGHGAAMLLQDRLLLNSDKTIVPVCKKCGVLAINDTIRGKEVCPLCKGNAIVQVTMPYAFKLALDELKALHIYPKLVVEE